MATDADRIAALEAWVDAVTPTLRALARRAMVGAPDRDASGAEVGLIASGRQPHPRLGRLRPTDKSRSILRKGNVPR